MTFQVQRHQEPPSLQVLLWPYTILAGNSKH